MIFYDRIPDMECLSGDTLPDFIVDVDAEGGIGSCRMQVIVSRSDDPSEALVCKECTRTGSSFQVQLDSSDTRLPEDTYDIHFRLITPDGKSYRKLYGSIYVHSVAGGGL